MGSFPLGGLWRLARLPTGALLNRVGGFMPDPGAAGRVDGVAPDGLPAAKAEEVDPRPPGIARLGL